MATIKIITIKKVINTDTVKREEIEGAYAVSPDGSLWEIKVDDLGNLATQKV